MSRDYPEFQADVVDFVLANLVSLCRSCPSETLFFLPSSLWTDTEPMYRQDEVIATPGWKRVLTLLDEGKIPGGGSIMHKILSGSRKGRTEACYAIISVANCE